MKKSFGFFAAALTMSCIVPAMVAPSTAEAAAPEALVYSIDGSHVKIDYSAYQDVLFGTAPDLGKLIKGKAPNALGAAGKFIKYSSFQDLLFEHPDKSALQLIDMALNSPSNLVDDATTSSYKTIVKFENGQPVYSEPSEQGDLVVEDIY